MNIPRVIAVVAAATSLFTFATIASSQTINFGAALPDGPVPAGYGGFNWPSATNDAQGFGMTGPAASIVGFDRSQLFNFNSVDYQFYQSFTTYGTSFFNYTTVISGYRGNTLLDTVTEKYSGSAGGYMLFSGLGIDGVNKVTFSTTVQSGYLDNNGVPVVVTQSQALPTFIDQIKVQSAPEIDYASTATALTLLLGFLAVLRGRRAA
jgi:hypothetical protein